MNWPRAYLVFLMAFGLTVCFNIERVSDWSEEHLAEDGPDVNRGLRKVRDAWRGSFLAEYSRRVDCLVVPLFDETYKSSLACRPEAAPPTGMAGRDRQPLVKGPLSIDRSRLRAALDGSADRSESGTEDDATRSEPATLAASRPAPPPAPPASGQESEALYLRQDKLPPPHKILVVGDSLAIGLSLSLRREAAEYDDLSLFEEGKVSSGLANPKYFNWENVLRLLMDRHAPNIVVIMMGANDAKYINVNEKPRPPGSTNKTWQEVFSMRVEAFLRVLADRDVQAYWIGLPIMGDPAYARQVETMNEIVRDECLKFPFCRYVDTWGLLADESGNYASFVTNDKGVKVKVRANDKIHFTVAGGDILVRRFFDALTRDAALKMKPAKETAAREGAEKPATP